MEKPERSIIDQLLHPAGAYRRPSDVLEDRDLTIAEKRAILASWASDACTVEATPELRRSAAGPPVKFDEIMDALRALDEEALHRPDYGRVISRASRLRGLLRANREGRSPFA